AFSEVYRILKPSGHFSISDIVLVGELPEKIKSAAEMYAGCVASAIQKEDYLKIIENSGFKNISLQKEKAIIVPDDILKNYLNEQEIDEYKNSNSKIFSITVYAEKGENSCDPNSGCC
ncbi:MAG TPA: arsenite S-adenosylmethyltransferase, partial [Kaistella sp.]|nr:arsenite S-adenosylmethyltransferase [Kaistella sp.]